MTRTKLFSRSMEVMVAWAAALATLLGPAGACRASLSDCYDATCRVTSQRRAVRMSDGQTKTVSPSGSGTVFEISRGKIYVLTAAHVADRPSCACQFYRFGHESAEFPAATVARDARADVALVVVSVESLGGVLPKVIPIAEPGTVLAPGEELLSVGMANGAWPTGWKGHILKAEGGKGKAEGNEEIIFVPPPAEGRSGSALFDAAGTKIVGVVRARMEDGRSAVGLAIPLAAIYRAFRSPVAYQAVALTEPVQCPGGVCPNCPSGMCPYCPNGQCPNCPAAPAVEPGPWPTLGKQSRPEAEDTALLPWRADQEKRQQQIEGNIQSLGAEQAETNRHLGQIEDILEKMETQKAPPPAESKSQPKSAAEEALERQAERLARLPGPIGPQAQKVEADLAAGNTDQALRDGMKIVGGVLAVLGVIAAITLHLIGQHKGALRVLADNLAAQNPNNATLTSLAQKLDSVEDKIAAKLPAMPPLQTLPMAVPAPAAPPAAPAAAVDPAANAKADLLAQQVSQLAGQVGQLQTNAMPKTGP